jgi:hypothetical protein
LRSVLRRGRLPPALRSQSVPSSLHAPSSSDAPRPLRRSGRDSRGTAIRSRGSLSSACARKAAREGAPNRGRRGRAHDHVLVSRWNEGAIRRAAERKEWSSGLHESLDGDPGRSGPRSRRRVGAHPCPGRVACRLTGPGRLPVGSRDRVPGWECPGHRREPSQGGVGGGGWRERGSGSCKPRQGWSSISIHGRAPMQDSAPLLCFGLASTAPSSCRRSGVFTGPARARLITSGLSFP